MLKNIKFGVLIFGLLLNSLLFADCDDAKRKCRNECNNQIGISSSQADETFKCEDSCKAGLRECEETKGSLSDKCSEFKTKCKRECSYSKTPEKCEDACQAGYRGCD